MTKHLLILTAAVLLTGWAAAQTAATEPVAATAKALPQGLPGRTLPAAIGMQTKPGTSTAEELTKIRAAGAGFIRRGFYWREVEKEKGKYDFTTYDELLKNTEARGLRVLGCLFSGNRLYGKGAVMTEPGRQGFAAFAAALASRYKGRGIIWEVWNEPNTRTFWRKNGKHNSPPFAAEYTALVKATAGAMLKADPDCFIVAGAVSCLWEPSFRWIDSCFSKGILESGIKGWSLHPYGVKRPEDFSAGYMRVNKILKKHKADHLPLINSERGFAVKKRREGWSGGSEEKAVEYQSWHVVRQYMVDQMNGIRLTIWYEWGSKDFGLHHNGAKRPGHTAFRTMVTQLSGYTYKERLKADDREDYLLLFTNADGNRKLVAWTAPPPKGAPNLAKPHDITIPVTNTEPVSIVDLMGRAGTVAVTNGKITINLKPAVQYLDLGIAPAAAPAAAPAQP